MEISGKLSLHELPHWIERYNNAGTNLDYPAPAKTLSSTQQCKAVVCSNLRRSLESAQHLGYANITVSDALFREMEIPYLCCKSPKAAPMFWATLFRLAWFAGFSRNGEKINAAKQRALQAATTLITLAQQHNSVLFVGHGFINHYIAKALQAQGWQGPAKAHREYWASSVYTR